MLLYVFRLVEWSSKVLPYRIVNSPAVIKISGHDARGVLTPASPPYSTVLNPYEFISPPPPPPADSLLYMTRIPTDLGRPTRGETYTTKPTYLYHKTDTVDCWVSRIYKWREIQVQKTDFVAERIRWSKFTKLKKINTKFFFLLP